MPTTIRFNTLHRIWNEGDVVEEGNGVAELLIQRGIATAVSGDLAGSDGPTVRDRTEPNTPLNRRLRGPREDRS